MYLLIHKTPRQVLHVNIHLHPTMYLLIRNFFLALLRSVRFTSHYVSINSFKNDIINIQERKFTSHYVSINSFYRYHIQLLLNKFTSHYVSINSPSRLSYPIACYTYLHPTMYLLIRQRKRHKAYYKHDLHPTMYLLIPVIIKASLFLNSEALFCLPFKSANRLLILYALNMLEA